jgi:hypothetical protein
MKGDANLAAALAETVHAPTLDFTCRPYHPSSSLINRTGYYPNLEPEHIHALQEFKNVILSESSDKIGPHGSNQDEEDDHLKMLRFLRARNFDVQKSLDLYRKDQEWRRSTFITDPPKGGVKVALCSIGELRHQTAQDVLECHDKEKLQKFFSYFQNWVQGYDRELRPVSWRKFGRLETWSVLKLTTMENLARFHAWESEQALRMMRQQSDVSGYNIETFAIVCDLEGWHLGLATSEAFTFIKHLASIDSDHYPERLGRCVIINAPKTLSISWKVIKTFLDDVTKKKVQILSDRKEWLPVLLEFIDEDQIPRHYGGTAPNFTQEQAFASMNPPPPPPQPNSTLTSSNGIEVVSTATSSNAGVNESVAIPAETSSKLGVEEVGAVPAVVSPKSDVKETGAVSSIYEIPVNSPKSPSNIRDREVSVAQFGCTMAPQRTCYGSFFGKTAKK